MLNTFNPFECEVVIPSHSSEGSLTQHVQAEVCTTQTILSWPIPHQQQLRAELEFLIQASFPKMAEDETRDLAEHYFRRPWKTLQRYAILLRDPTNRLIGSYLCDYGELNYNNEIFSGCYVILNLALPEYQGLGLGKMMAMKTLLEVQPDVLLITCYQSAILHAYVDLLSKQGSVAYDVYPRLEVQDDKECLITFPYQELDFAIQMFKCFFWGVVRGDEQQIASALNYLTIHLVRKDNHADVYDFHPWRRAGREDRLAQALGATERDAILVMFRKKTVEI